MATYVVIWFTCLLACCLSATTNDGNSKPETSKDPCSNQTIPACVNATSDALKKDLCSLLNYHVRQYCYKAGAPFSFADKTNATYLTEENVCQQINSSRKFVKNYSHQNVWNNTECTQFCSSSKELCNSWITLIKKLYTIGTDGNKSKSNDTSGNSSKHTIGTDGNKSKSNDTSGNSSKHTIGTDGNKSKSNDTSGNSSKHTIGTDGNKSKSNDTSGNSSKLPNEADGNDKRKLKDSNVTNVNTSNSKPEDSLPPSNGVNVMKSKPSNSSASRTGASSTGASSTGASSTGTSSTGASSTGTSSTGASRTGTSSTGASSTGTSSTGASSTGTSSTGASSTGTSSTGASSTVAPNSAVPNSGASNSKTGDSSQDTKNLNSKQREFTEAPSSAHFMGYFLTAIILCITGYVLFHNKQKIIAFIIEGRHRKRGRRPNSGEYRKLQTQVDDVMHSLDKSTSSQNYIY